jgi:chemotaxis-related protein WspB
VLFLLFYLDDDCYALDAREIDTVIPMLKAKRIPRAPSAIAGVIDYRGAVVPVVDLAALALGRPAAARTSTRIVLVNYRKAELKGRLLGVMVERATKTMSCDPSAFQDTGVATPNARYLGPVTGGPRGLVQWVTVDALLTPDLNALLFAQAWDG